MAVAIIEQVPSRAATVSTENPSATLSYVVAQTFLDTAVHALVKATVPAFYLGLVFQSYQVKHDGNGIWSVDVTYGKKEPKTPGTLVISWDTTGEKQHITQAILSHNFPAIGQPPINFQDAINVSKAGGTTKVTGLDIPLRGLSLTVKRTFGPPSFPLNSAQLYAMYDKSNKVNNDIVTQTINGLAFNFPIGTLRYDGVTGSQTNQDDMGNWTTDIEMKFAYSPNITGKVLAGITFNKLGWEYFWLSYEEDQDTDTIVQRVRQIVVQQVLETTDLTPLFT